MKRCYLCGETKEEAEFWKGQYVCKPCGKARNQAYMRKRQEQAKEHREAFAGQTKRCTKCGETKPVAEFLTSAGGAMGRRSHCMVCDAGDQKGRYHRKHVDATYKDAPHFSESLGCVAKICSICKVEKPVTEFHHRYHRYSAPCKVCKQAEQKRAYDADPEKFRKRSRDYWHAHPEKAERDRQWRQANHDKMLLCYHRYYQEHREDRLAYARKRRANKPSEYWAAERAKRGDYWRRYHVLNRERINANSRLWLINNPDKHADKQQRRRARMQNAPRVERIDRKAVIVRDQGTCYLCGAKPMGSTLTLDHVIPLARGGSHTAENLRVACLSCNLAKHTKLLSELHPPYTASGS